MNCSIIRYQIQGFTIATEYYVCCRVEKRSTYGVDYYVHKFSNVMSSLVIGQLPGATALYLLRNLGRAQLTSSTQPEQHTDNTDNTDLLHFLFGSLLLKRMFTAFPL
ncbi:hypothetical protein ACN38_g5945 [Penicillium nordicum]|uniref:Uncharacterized protein n=1 Tax=Penicillium nordicum TaxID=229535 RepID=A0A0M8P8W4_9EURO|nr:hypothetical protein ACN38_g5945 [Penicillium nordicum]